MLTPSFGLMSSPNPVNLSKRTDGNAFQLVEELPAQIERVIGRNEETVLGTISRFHLIAGDCGVGVLSADIYDVQLLSAYRTFGVSTMDLSPRSLS